MTSSTVKQWPDDGGVMGTPHKPRTLTDGSTAVTFDHVDVAQDVNVDHRAMREGRCQMQCGRGDNRDVHACQKR